jgi:hypothetical protein
VAADLSLIGKYCQTRHPGGFFASPINLIDSHAVKKPTPTLKHNLVVNIFNTDRKSYKDLLYKDNEVHFRPVAMPKSIKPVELSKHVWGDVV